MTGKHLRRLLRRLVFPLRGLLCRFRGGRGWRTRQVELRVLELVRGELAALPPDEALRMLFRLDAELYRAQSEAAVAYGKGVHPKHRHLRYHDFFVGRVRPGERVLDAGCGTGRLAFDLARHARAEVVGIDISPTNVRIARQSCSHPRIQFRVGDVAAGELGGSFDVVVLSNVLEHISRRSELLRRLVEQNGVRRFLIRVPLFERDWRVPLKKELGVEWRLDDSHQLEYTVEEFREEMAEAGLDIRHLQVGWGELWSELAVISTKEDSVAPTTTANAVA